MVNRPLTNDLTRRDAETSVNSVSGTPDQEIEKLQVVLSEFLVRRDTLPLKSVTVQGCLDSIPWRAHRAPVRGCFRRKATVYGIRLSDT